MIEDGFLQFFYWFEVDADEEAFVEGEVDFVEFDRAYFVGFYLQLFDFGILLNGSCFVKVF